MRRLEMTFLTVQVGAGESRWTHYKYIMPRWHLRCLGVWHVSLFARGYARAKRSSDDVGTLPSPKIWLLLAFEYRIRRKHGGSMGRYVVNEMHLKLSFYHLLPSSPAY